MSSVSGTGPASPGEQVVLLDEGGRAIGVADKRAVHGTETPLHLAFSCYLFDPAGRLLVTQRALHKPTFPGVWTNSCCGHPSPGEGITASVRRRVREELGVDIDDLRLALPTFRYRAEMTDGTVENEICPVFTATTTSLVVPDADEVAACVWVPWTEFRSSVLDGSRDVSAWCLAQVRALPAEPLLAAAGSSADLPPAARAPE